MHSKTLYAAAVGLLLAGCPREASIPGPVIVHEESAAAGSGRGPTTNRPVVPPDDAPVFQLTAREYYDAYKADEDSTVDKYRGAWVELTGQVDEIGVGGNDYGGYLLYIRLVADPAPGQPTPFINTDFIHCYVKEPEPWTKVAGGGRVTLRGTLAHGALYRGFFDHCTIVDAAGGPTPTLTASELAQRFLADAAAVRQTLHEKPVVVSGEVAVNGADDSLYIYDVHTLLKGEGDTLIALHYTTFENRQFASLQPGEKVLVIGKLHVAEPDKVGDDESEKLRLGVTFAYRLDLVQ